MDAALTKRISDPKLSKIGLARVINIKSGGAVIAPWEVDQLDLDWLDAFLSEIPETIAAHDKRVADLKSEFYRRNLRRAKH